VEETDGVEDLVELAVDEGVEDTVLDAVEEGVEDAVLEAVEDAVELGVDDGVLLAPPSAVSNNETMLTVVESPFTIVPVAV